MAPWANTPLTLLRLALLKRVRTKFILAQAFFLRAWCARRSVQVRQPLSKPRSRPSVLPSMWMLRSAS
eukprot:5835549-Pyramimonas_sp.AAC.1